ncbi:MAG: sulfatase-like hydrolase/transferase [Acidobacteriota bacterium]|nr:sulfatase-like hydrolase/transferase [Acidobacteriota bacterium]
MNKNVADSMTRNYFFRSLAGGAFAGAQSIRSLPGQAHDSGRPKNVLLLMSDQHRRDGLGIEGNRFARTPHLDALARSGARFGNAYCSNPVCVPSRASLLTGLYTHNHGALNNTKPLAFQKKTAAHYFGRAGYMTGLIGKMHFVDAQTHGFDYHLDFNDWYQYLGPKTKLYADELSRANSGSGMPEIDDLWRDEGDPWSGARTLDGRKGPVAVGRASEIPEKDHFESFVARETVRFLEKHGREQPFFLISSVLKPHDPFMPARRFAAQFRADDMQLPDTWGKVDLTRVPRLVRESIEHNAPTPELKDPALARERMALYYANIAQMDDAFGHVLDALHLLKLDQDTVVIYTSDHGEMLGEHGLWQKFQFYEGSCGVPLIFRVPGAVKPGGNCSMPVSQVQVLPTIAELCGVELPALDGPSFAAQLSNPAKTHPNPVFAEYDLATPRAKYMYRMGDYKYTFWANDIPELYNLRNDPKEMTNLAGQPAHGAVESEMKNALFAWHTPTEVGLTVAPGRRPERSR